MNRVQNIVASKRSLLADAGVLIFLAAVLFGVVQVARDWHAPLKPEFEIHLDFVSLIGYTLLSLLRGFLAYGLSLIFTFVYGYLAASSPLLERILVPILDILQSIPVLGFLPGVVLALVTLFPHTNTGLELACILMIFTGQVWNMVFSFYHSLKTIPEELREVGRLYHFSPWQRFLRIELPASATGLAWNSMLSMSGGWFFLMICESFTLGEHDFRLPGLGAYMSVAATQKNIPAIVAGMIAMVTMIVFLDLIVWRPVLHWVERFRMDDSVPRELKPSRFFNWLENSLLFQQLRIHLSEVMNRLLMAKMTPTQSAPARNPRHWSWRKVFGMLLVLASAISTIWAASQLFGLLHQIHPSEWFQITLDALLTLVRVALSVILGSLWTIPVGIWIGHSQLLRRRLQPIVQVAAAFPVPMLYPLILLGFKWLGIGLNFGSVFLMLLGTQWYILFNVIAGASSVPGDFLEVAQMYQFNRSQRWHIIWWPAIFPHVITGWITAAGGAWNASIVAEYLNVGGQSFVAHGLGSAISIAASRGEYGVLAAGILTMALVVVLINRYVWKPLVRTAEENYAY